MTAETPHGGWCSSAEGRRTWFWKAHRLAREHGGMLSAPNTWWNPLDWIDAIWPEYAPLHRGAMPEPVPSPAARCQPEPWKVALQALTRAAIIRGQSRPDASPEDLERDLYALEEAVCILRERA